MPLSDIIIHVPVRPLSRGITDANLTGDFAGKRPNLKILGATHPEAVQKYADAAKVLCF